MKIVVSQDGLKVFTVGTNNFVNIVPVEIENPKITLFSIGIGGVSFGVYTEQANAQKVLDELVLFLCGDGNRFFIPMEIR